MNERIRELAEQATDKWVGGQFFDRERFAELIIRECAKVSLKNSHRNDDMGAIIARQISKHFGVE